MFNNAFSFNGRIRRSEFGLSFIIYLFALYTVSALVDNRTPSAVSLLIIPMIWFLSAQGAKRCHDLGKSGWWQIIPFYGFWLLLQDGGIYPNEYGYNPKSAIFPDNDNYIQPVEDHTDDPQ